MQAPPPNPAQQVSWPRPENFLVAHPHPLLLRALREETEKEEELKRVITLKGLLSPAASTNGLTSKSDMASGSGSANSAVTPAGFVRRRSVANFLDFAKFSTHARRSLSEKRRAAELAAVTRSGGRRQVSTA